MNPTSYSAAAEAYVERCPPIPGSRWLARVTIAIAFQRTMRRMRFSISSSPGNGGSCSGEIVLMYGVWIASIPRCCMRARLRTLRRRNLARSGPAVASTRSSDSIHSAVSWGSAS